jgi:ligand-binding sensor domain-containing protein
LAYIICGGLHKYDGTKFITYTHDPHNLNSLANNWTECIARDSANFLWVGTWGSGLDRFDPATNIFKHFRHDPKEKESVLNDTITAILADRSGNLWIGSYGGLDVLNEKTGRFTHYPYVPGDTSGLSSNEIRVLYEDRNGTIWVGCGSPFNENPSVGGLNRFDRTTGKFTRYMHDPRNPNSIENNKVLGLLEDSKGNFWVGTSGDGLHIMDRSKGTFTHYHYDEGHPEKLSRPPVNKERNNDHISFIKEDPTGAIWIGSFYGGVNRYDPKNKKVEHFGNVMQGDKIVFKGCDLWLYRI